MRQPIKLLHIVVDNPGPLFAMLRALMSTEYSVLLAILRMQHLNGHGSSHLQTLYGV